VKPSLAPRPDGTAKKVPMPSRRASVVQVSRVFGRQALSRPLHIVLLLFAAAVLVCLAARWVLGARGLLVPALLFTFVGTSCGAWLGRRWLRGAGDPRLSATNRRLLVAMAVLPLSFAAFSGWQLVQVSADMLLPFDQATLTVQQVRYAPTGRGPGSTRLLTQDGREYQLPPLADLPSAPVPGRYRAELSHLLRLVMTLEPISGT
jgi:hypothetical protein